MSAFDPSEAPSNLSADTGGCQQGLESVRAAFRPQLRDGAAAKDSTTHWHSQARGDCEWSAQWRAEANVSKPVFRLAGRTLKVVSGVSIFLCGAVLGLFAEEAVRGDHRRDSPGLHRTVASASSDSYVLSMPAIGPYPPRGISRSELPYEGGMSTPREQHAESDADAVPDKAARQREVKVRRPAAAPSSRPLKHVFQRSFERGVVNEKSSTVPMQEGASAQKSGNLSMQRGGSNRQGASKPSLVSPTTTREGLAQCKRPDNFIAREKCKWRICSGRWGKDGCPSFRQQPHYF